MIDIDVVFGASIAAPIASINLEAWYHVEDAPLPSLII
jgi:hypothetical protein